MSSESDLLSALLNQSVGHIQLDSSLRLDDGPGAAWQGAVPINRSLTVAGRSGVPRLILDVGTLQGALLLGPQR